MINRLEIPVENTGSEEIKLEMEPEGDWLPLGPGERCVVRLTSSEMVPPDVALELRGPLILLYSSAEKEVWQGEKRIR